MLNLYLKDLLRTRRNGTFSVEDELARYALTATYTGRLRNIIKRTFSERTITAYSSYKSRFNIRNAAHICFNKLLRNAPTVSAALPFYALDLFIVGIRRLVEGEKCRAFSAKVYYNNAVLDLPEAPEPNGIDEALPDP